jgi:thioredoxin 1
MVGGRILFIAMICMAGPPAAVFVWQKGQEYQELQAIPPQQLPGSVVMVYSPSCGPCKTMMPVIQQVQAEGYRIRTVNARSEPTLAKQWKVRAVPTFIYFKDGQEKYRSVGGMSQKELREFCRGIWF